MIKSTFEQELEEGMKDYTQMVKEIIRSEANSANQIALKKCLDDIDEIIDSFDKNHLTTKTKGFCNGLRKSIHIIQKHYGELK